MGLKTAKKYIYAGTTDVANVTFANLTNSDSLFITEVTSKKEVSINLTASRDYWWIAAPKDLGYEIYSGTIKSETGYDIYYITKDGIEYKVWPTAVKSAAINVILK